MVDSERLKILSADAADVKVTDMMIRLLGPTVDKRFGAMARKLKQPCNVRSEFKWTELLIKHMREDDLTFILPPPPEF